MHLDTVELLAWFLLAMPIGVTVRDTWGDKIVFPELMNRTGAILAVIVGVRAAPTGKITDFLANTSIGKK